jgi:hypothetical protein
LPDQLIKPLICDPTTSLCVIVNTMGSAWRRSIQENPEPHGPPGRTKHQVQVGRMKAKHDFAGRLV